MKRLLKILGGAAVAILLLLALGAGWFWHQIDASIPQYDGTLTLAGLINPVTIERDALGVVTIHADHALDEVRALGFVHAQERFFQMDLLRRSAAGELSGLVGGAAVRMDEQRRRHRLRRTARETVTEAPAEYRALVEAYTEGVNAGLGALRAKPFEYLLLRTTPEPWRAEDTVLAVAAMYFDLQGGTALHKRSEVVARELLPPDIADFLYPRRTAWDAPIVGDAVPEATIPAPETYDLRTLPRDWFEGTTPSGQMPPFGSNNWAVAGPYTASGRGLLANDMHLGLQAPSIWFRASLRRQGRHVTGISLPGTPLIVVGSNGRVAWGFTNSYGDWLDLIILELDPQDPQRYLTPTGWKALEEVTETIDVANGTPVETRFMVTAWGPVMGELPDGRPYAVRWVAHDPEGYAPGFLALESTNNVDEALAAAQRSGIPAQNFVVADADGHIAWTIMGRMPRRVRDATVSSVSAEGPAWDGWLNPEEYPVVRTPATGRLWTANSRVVEGEMLAQIGDGGYALGDRARQIRDRLMAVDAATPADMLAIQLDDEALFYARWREQLLALLDDATIATDQRFHAVRDAVRDWGGHAAVDSVGFRLVRGWRNTLIADVLSALTAEIRQHDSQWVHRSFRNETWAWPLVSEEPEHLLHPAHASWRDMKLAALDQLLDNLGVQSPADLAQRTWGQLNIVRIQHPLSQAVPLLGRWLDMPAQALPGDGNTPRVQTVRFGASQRMAVSPGDEANGYFHMPGGQSGHPRSHFYGAGHQDWVDGKPTPFMPGAAVHTLRLSPDPAVTALPSGPLAVAPNLSRTPDGSTLLSWIEPLPAGGHALKFSRRSIDGAWSTPGVIAHGDDWFVNWADFPALVELGDGTLVAHWLQKSSPSTYAYDVVVSRSVDGGSTWSAGERPHTDGTQTEHGFVSMLPVAHDRVRMVWLDGRETGGGGHGAHVHGHQGEGTMTLRTRTLSSDGRWGEETLLDASVCDCCQTAAVNTSRGSVIVYRNRTSDEIRDIWFVTEQGDSWSQPRPVHEDGWHITGCPVNGPAVVADGDDLAVAWFTGAGGVAQLLLAISRDAGETFGEPLRMDSGKTLGRAGAVMTTDGLVWVSWLDAEDEDGAIRLRSLDRDGVLGQTLTVARSSAARGSGFPRIAAVSDGLLMVWTEPGTGLRAALHR